MLFTFSILSKTNSLPTTSIESVSLDVSSSTTSIESVSGDIDSLSVTGLKICFLKSISSDVSSSDFLLRDCLSYSTTSIESLDIGFISELISCLYFTKTNCFNTSINSSLFSFLFIVSKIRLIESLAIA